MSNQRLNLWIIVVMALIRNTLSRLRIRPPKGNHGIISHASR